MKRFVFALVLTCAELCSAVPLQASTFSVNTTQDGHDAVLGDGVCETAAANEVCTLRAAIEETNALAGPDAVTVPAGLYSLTTVTAGGRALAITGDLILSGAGSARTVVDALNLDVVVVVPAGATVEVSGLTITGGHGRNVGGISNAGDLTLRNCVVSSNAADYPGGGINNGGVLTLVASTVTGNSAYTGAGIFNSGTLNVTASDIVNNPGQSGGGGLWNDGAAAVATITESRIAGNTAGGYGGGAGIVNRSGGAVHLVRSTMSGNTHWRFAGGIANDFDSTVTITNSTVSGNVTTAYDGGGIWNRGTLSLVHSTVTANHSKGGGGGVANSGVVTLEGSIIAGNTAGWVGPDCWGTVTSAGHNLIQSTADCTIVGDATGNLTGVDPLLGPLADNNGPTESHALLEGSPAIDAAGLGCPDVDQRNAPRPVDGNNDGSATCDIGAFESLSVPAAWIDLSAVSPNRGGDNGSVSALLTGRGFTASAEVRLLRSGEAPIPGTPVTAGQAGTVLITRFDLAGRARGSSDLEVKNVSGATAVLPGGFTVEETRLPKLWVGITGRNAIAPLHPTRYRIAFGNDGNVDAFAVPLTIGGLPKDVDFGLNVPPLPPPPQNGQVAMDWSQVPVEVIGDGLENVHSAPLLLSVLPPGLLAWLDVTINIPTGYADGTEFVLQADLATPLAAPAPDPPVVDALAGGAVSYALRDFGVVIPAGIVPEMEQYLAGALEQVVAGGSAAWVGSLGTRGGVYAISHLVIDTALFGAAQSGEITSARARGNRGVNNPNPPECRNELGGYIRIPVEGGPARCIIPASGISSWRSFPLRPSSWRLPLSFAVDPNGKAGPAGAGEARFVPGAQPQGYEVFFENLSSASAPAQEVVVTDALDKTSFDTTTFELGSIAFGDVVLDVPPGLVAFETEVDLRPGKNLLVKVEAGLNVATGVATWRFLSIDPETKEPPDDPLVGFLPPNVTPPEGEGNVLFSVRPLPKLPTGSELRNKARIVFDVNDPIDTPEWLNTIDATAPVSQIDTVTFNNGAECEATDLTLYWSGTDEGSGIASYDVFVSKDGGPAYAIAATSDASMPFTAAAGRHYAFYTVATDHAGNVQESPATPDFDVCVPAPPLCGDANGDNEITATDALQALRAAVGLGECVPCLCDVDGSASVMASDALAMLRLAVALPIPVNCPAC